MKKIIATTFVALGLATGAIAPANADIGIGPYPVRTCDINDYDALQATLTAVNGTVEQYKTYVVTLQGQIGNLRASASAASDRADRLQRVADRRAATIERLRAKLAARR